MQRAILAGPDGGPAIDQETGQPLTMEELLRRRGYVAYNGVVRPPRAENATATPADTAATATTPVPTPADVATPGAEVPVAPVMVADAPNTGAGATPTGAAAPANSATASAGAVDPTWATNPAAALQAASSETGMTPQEIEAATDDELGALLKLMGVGGATALGWYLGNRNTPPAAGRELVPVSEPIDGTVEPQARITGNNIQDGEFTVVNEAQQRRLPQSQRRLTGPSSEVGRVMMEAGQGVMAGRPPQARLPAPQRPARPRTRLPRVR